MSYNRFINLNIFNTDIIAMSQKIAEMRKANTPITNIENGQSKDFAKDLALYLDFFLF